VKKERDVLPFIPIANHPLSYFSLLRARHAAFFELSQVIGK